MKTKNKTHHLQGRWTVSLDQCDPEVGENVEKEMAKVLQEEIDWEVMIEVMIEIGWTKVNIDWPNQMSAVDAHKVKEWCRANLQGHYKGRNKIWLFEQEKDAILFVLRWS